MSISVASASGNILLSGDIQLAESEVLLRLLIDNPDASVDWRACETCHTAVMQVLLAAERRMIGPPAGRFLSRFFHTD